MILGMMKRSQSMETIPNSIIQDFKEEFNGLSQEGWIKYKLWVIEKTFGLIKHVWAKANMTRPDWCSPSKNTFLLLIQGT